MSLEAQLRAQIVARCRELDARGLNRGASGNVSARVGEVMLITPSAVPYAELAPGMIAAMPLADADGAWAGPLAPSSEWRFHRDLLRARPDIGAVVHTHAAFSTILAIARKPIPAIHYMIAAFGGMEIPCCDYACYGTPELSAAILRALGGMNGCLMANHGMLTVGPDLPRATWLAFELEALAHQYWHVLQIGGGHVLSEAEIATVAKGFASYGVKATD
ncbi:class II aldolase/adducin family protein [Roseicyclus mahoneyensis]|uniref:L-fuculose 1-phosphate aldolase n=1 Tax=Roseicyclus mahoneyensis TaxID=164332 RepID=A0A316GGV1_9RHOB|nr:class II aldolase/adducin family protein [Roseicyclus mahoneyensis]PWK60242.1 L-fuculose 1-phosphate aldolase [Roseicyclus mahoneyensis]